MIIREGISSGDRTCIRVDEGGGACQVSVAGSSVMIASLLPSALAGRYPGLLTGIMNKKTRWGRGKIPGEPGGDAGLQKIPRSTSFLMMKQHK
jgi:hypothetical protein